MTVSNNQTGSTSSPFQQMVAVDSFKYALYEAPNLQNVEFFYPNGTVIPSWLEGNPHNPQQITNLYQDSATTYWLQIKQIQGNSNLVIYMGFAANGVNLFDGSVVGEAPWLTANYSQYDNGAAVFLAYFNGAAPVSNFSMAPGFGINTQSEIYGTSTIPTIHMYGAVHGEDVYFVYNKQIPNQPVIEETNFESQDLQADTGFIGLAGAIPSSTNVAFSYIGYVNSKVIEPYGSYEHPGAIQSTWNYGTMYYLQGSGFLSEASSELYQNCGCSLLREDPLSNDQHFYIGSAVYLNTTNYTGTPVDIFFNFARVRAYPPGGAMPAVLFGSLTTAPVTTTSTTSTTSITTSVPAVVVSVPPGFILPLIAVILAVCAIILLYRKHRISQERESYYSSKEDKESR